MSVSRKALGTQTQKAKGESFFWNEQIIRPRAQQLPWDFYRLKGNLPVIPSAATRQEPLQQNKSFKEQSAFILGKRSMLSCF